MLARVRSVRYFLFCLGGVFQFHTPAIEYDHGIPGVSAMSMALTVGKSAYLTAVVLNSSVSRS